MLKKRIEELNIEAESYAISLTRRNCNTLCDQICGKLSVPKTWKLLRVLIDPNGTRTATYHRVNKLVHLAEGSDEEVIQRLAEKYICTDPPEDQPEYEGEPNEGLDRPITAEELRAELTLMKKTAAPGPDSITTRHLFNLDEDTIAQLVEHFHREYWDLGLGVHNTVEELWEAQKLAQRRRINKTTNGPDWTSAKSRVVIVVIGQSVRSDNFGPNFVFDEFRGPEVFSRSRLLFTPSFSAHGTKITHSECALWLSSTTNHQTPRVQSPLTQHFSHS
ncbi:hypothetical protein HPB47_004061 [Ixodes persulcatus]|uniref:Uncharacterized protein n=1 Tax=Ixodes persulcatus TaxID=34615 RepID=A0AC60PGQ3_IXOPE|nr:hypothetical protein HPB47_004061 [Ixodes persulcatus]